MIKLITQKMFRKGLAHLQGGEFRFSHRNHWCYLSWLDHAVIFSVPLDIFFNINAVRHPYVVDEPDDTLFGTAEHFGQIRQGIARTGK